VGDDRPLAEADVRVVPALQLATSAGVASEDGDRQRPGERGWHAYLTTDDDEPADALVYCPDCANRELGHRGARGSA
jgi:hypothetical protein